MKTRTLAIIILGALIIMPTSISLADTGPFMTKRAQAHDLKKEGNYKEALDIYKWMVLNKKTLDSQAGPDLSQAVVCLKNLGFHNKIDQLVEKAVSVHSKNWRLLHRAAEIFYNGGHYGYIVSGKFHRGHHRGGGKYANAYTRDRVRALQLMQQALKNMDVNDNKNDIGNFYFRFANMIMGYQGYGESWRLQYLTDLSILPDYDEGYYNHPQVMGAPVNKDGAPVFYDLPKDFQSARNDGERWRCLLQMAVKANPENLNRSLFARARFLYNQFGVQTMADSPVLFGPQNDDKKDQSGPFDVHTLSDSETLAKLATGVKRFNLPDEHNFIVIYKKLAASGKFHAQNSLEVLADIYENRRQYNKAADIRKEIIKRYPGSKKQQEKKLGQIIGNLGRFVNEDVKAAGQNAAVDFIFRNGKKVSFEAHEIKVQALLDDMRNYIKTSPKQVSYRNVNLDYIGYRLVKENQTKYLGKKAADWVQSLNPRKKHFNRRITITTPLNKAGAYLLTAKMEDGNKSSIVLWIADTAIIKKSMDRKELIYVADAVSGRPLKDMNLHFFGYRRDNNIRENVIKEFSRISDENGQVIIDSRKAHNVYYQWLITATNDEGRLAFLGFTGIWGRSNFFHEGYSRNKAFGITDRPVYRPGQTVNYKFWMRRATYDQGDITGYVGQSFEVQIHDPQYKNVFSQSHWADEYGGMDGQYVLPEDAALGVYQMQIPRKGTISFRVEEYKKPEFEVEIKAPDEPVMLGEIIEAKISAKYYFGAPVANARVKYKVLRSEHSVLWHPRGLWDWLYGPGYWWFGYDYKWYPGWHGWGCLRPRWSWWWRGSTMPPEIVAQGEALTDEQGEFGLKIDTAIAKELMGNTDHKYEIIAEITDQSRRTIVSKGSVLAARKPFKVYAWVDKGHYKVGDVVQADFSAQTPNGKPISGKGEAVLYKISHKKDKIQETIVTGWGVSLDSQGRASLKMDASDAGQYRLSLKITDKKGRTQEGGYVFIVMGDGSTGREFVFDHIELVPEKREYAPGDTINLRVNTRAPDCTVMLFIRPTNGFYTKPEILRIKGKSIVHKIKISKKDMPNFFVEAVMVRNGKIYSETRQIAVPPEKKVLNVKVTPCLEKYKPGQKAHVDVQLTDINGEPFAGATVLSVYDRAVEYISGGSNVQDIRDFFWKWVRYHNPRTESSLHKRTSNLTHPGHASMGKLGVFGHLQSTEKMDSHGRLSKNRSRKGMALPAPAAPQSLGMVVDEEEALVKTDGFAVSASKPEASVEPHVRTQFADTAFWAASVQTDKNGHARVSFDMPENLTSWKIRAWAMGSGTRVGEGQAEVVTTKDLLLRLQSPRFFVETDEVVLSANIHNYLEKDKKVRAVLELDGKSLIFMAQNGVQEVVVPANGEKRVDWRVKAVKEGEAVVRMKAITDEESDAMEMRFPVYVHGMEKTESYCGVIRPDEHESVFVIDVPQKRRAGESCLEIRYSPTLAGAMVDALPYLVSYPYGCTEQTLNRFLPTVITLNILKKTGVDLEKLRQKHTNLNAQEIGDPKDRAAQWNQWQNNPVFDPAKVARMAQKGVDRLTAMQMSDGGWGWFSGYGEHSSAHTTATVVRGLLKAKENSVGVVPGMLNRGVNWIKAYQEKQITLLKRAKDKKNKLHSKSHADNIDVFIFMVLADAGHGNDAMEAFLIRDKNYFSVYGKTLLGMALHKLGHIESRDRVMRNIEQYVVHDNENQTCYLNMGASGYWWYWYGSEFEAHAYYLKLLAATAPKSKNASGLVKYLLNNRKHGSRWKSTRDTALCIEALADYLKASGEDKPDMKISIYVDGKSKKEVAINADNLFFYDNLFVMEGKEITSGKHEIRIKRKGKGPVYFNAWMSNFTLEDFITKAGLEIKVDRKVYKLIAVDKTIKDAGARGQVLDRKVEKYKRQEMKNLEAIRSGELVEVELTIKSKNDYEYIVFEDFKPAGFEPIKIRSGYTPNSMGAYMELRDERVAFFVRSLARGEHSLLYRLRAETPGVFSALPTKAHAMYAPELKANSDEIKLKVVD